MIHIQIMTSFILSPYPDKLNKQGEIFSKMLQECPCLFKCDHEIRNTDYSNSNFDPLYGAKHEYAKNKIIDAIVDRFADVIDVSSE